MNSADTIVLGLEFSKLVPYFLVGFVGLFVGILYVLKAMRKEEFKSFTERLAYILQGVGSSMLVTWISYEITEYFFKLPPSLCVAISGGIGYLGAESISLLALKIIEKKM
ncbi:phage holin family protein [Helicobacter cetorum]|uniref:phage holin family protein n=1 Tax=Helicobacter cetorum TaxID=138563 RepID=UPI000CF147B4|nr:phage holin family protein [Helicobacter cetorum]